MGEPEATPALISFRYITARYRDDISKRYITTIHGRFTESLATGCSWLASEGRTLATDRVYHSGMALSGTSFDPTKPPRGRGPVVDYSLARRSVILAVRRGIIGTAEVCDAHPELMRAAKNIGEEAPDRCPICSHQTLRQVRYVFGDELKRDSGKVVYPPEWLSELVRDHDQFTCYLVEVCIDCSWNHLVRSYMTGRSYRSNGRRRERG